MDSAAQLAYARIDGTRKRPTYFDAINALEESGIIRESERDWWNAARYLRNRASHPEQATVMVLGAVLTMFQADAQDINLLWARVESS